LVEHAGRATAQPPQTTAGYRSILNPERRPQQTSDGWISVLPDTRDHYEPLFRYCGRLELLDERRLASVAAIIENSPTLYQDVAAVLKERPPAAWLDVCTRLGIPASPIATLDELVDTLPEAD